jgi:hypothetical protein
MLSMVCGQGHGYTRPVVGSFPLLKRDPNLDSNFRLSCFPHVFPLSAVPSGWTVLLSESPSRYLSGLIQTIGLSFAA